MERLKKCPFCGGEAKMQKKFANTESVVKMHFRVACMECGASIDWYTDKVYAIIAWNTRKSMERIVERLEKVKNREANGDCPIDGIIDGMCDKKPYECTSCYSNTAIQIVKEEM